jgi:hypothetical protein
MIEEIKILLGDAASNFTDAQISLCLKLALAEVEAYCRRPVDAELELVVYEITKIKLNRLNTEGLSAQSYSGVSESYIDGYPANIQNALNRKRKIKVV